jgi:lipopolysaccharide transport system permease protein
MSGTVVWSYFASCLTKTADTFAGNAHLFGKVYFPRLAVPISILISSLIGFAIQFILFLLFVVYFGLSGSTIRPNGWILFTPVLIFIMAGLGLGFGIIVSSLTTKYRDLRFLVSFGVQLMMYATPVILPISAVSGRLRWVMLANPMTSIVETFRYAYLGAGSLNAGQLLYSFTFMLVTMIIGVIIFNSVEKTFMDTV